MKMIETKNIFGNVPVNLKQEFFEEILSGNNFKIDRIVSVGHSSPNGFWYDQDKNEFVIVISGSARLSFNDGQIIDLKPGDYLTIPAHKKHRVDWTDPNQKTYWLALHY